jgi:hypothetical protein
MPKNNMMKKKLLMIEFTIIVAEGDGYPVSPVNRYLQ